MRWVLFVDSSLGYGRADSQQAKIEEYETQVADLQDQNTELEEKNSSLSEELAKLRQDNEKQASEISNLRSRSNLSQQNWVKERDDHISREAYAREEYENAKQAMQDWEVLAMNERSLRESLSEKEAELKEQLENIKDEFERAARERDQNSQAVEGLQKALQEVQNCESCRRVVHRCTYAAQCGDPSSRNPLRCRNPRSTIFESKFRPQRKPRKRRKPRPKRRRKSLKELYRLRRKSKRRTC